jgi:predicted ATP-dependent endonuclease of OLD family
MRISEVSIRGFRCFASDTFTLRDFTVLIGRNSSGKSTAIRSLQHFYDVGARVDMHDFHGGWTEGDEIEIGVIFANLTPEEIDVFGRKGQVLRVCYAG